MSTIEFIELRERIDHLIEETKLWVKKKSIHESSKRLESSNTLWGKMTLVDTKVEVKY